MWDYALLQVIWWEFQRQRPRMSLDFDVPETPEQVFYQKCEEIIPGNFVAMMKRECVVDV
jgi:hypothetical protein